MTMEVEIPRVSYAGDGATDTFATAFTFEFPLEVTVWRGEPSVQDCCAAPDYDNILQPSIDYDWLPGNYLVDGGTLRLKPHAVALLGTDIITLMRTTPPDQPEGFGDQEEFTPEQVEYSFDRVVRMIQELYKNPLGFLWLAGLAYTWRFYAPDEWTDDRFLDKYDFERVVAMAAGWVGCRASVVACDASELVCTIMARVDPDAEWEEVGSITIPAASEDTLVCTVTGVAHTFPSGGQCIVLPPEGGLGAAYGLSATFAGRVVG